MTCPLSPAVCDTQREQSSKLTEQIPERGSMKVIPRINKGNQIGCSTNFKDRHGEWFGHGGRQGNSAEQCGRDLYGSVLLALGRVGDGALAERPGSNRRHVEHELPVERTFHRRTKPEWRHMHVVWTRVDQGAEPGRRNLHGAGQLPVGDSARRLRTAKREGCHYALRWGNAGRHRQHHDLGKHFGGTPRALIPRYEPRRSAALVSAGPHHPRHRRGKDKNVPSCPHQTLHVLSSSSRRWNIANVNTERAFHIRRLARWLMLAPLTRAENKRW